MTMRSIGIMLAAGVFAAAFLLNDFMDHGHAILAHAGP